jgi:signal transduction histidine kinase/PleD family two-component response regulator
MTNELGSLATKRTSGQANVLLVDDKAENLLALESVLEDLGQNLVRAMSAREALRFLLLEDVALILLDVQMPGVNGFELAELIRERPRTQHTPIIFISATSVNDQYIFKGYSLGAVDYLTKPVEPEILKSKVMFFSRLFIQNQEIKRQSELLEQANLRLDNLNASLEARVQRRTEQLEAANRELENEIAVRKGSEMRLATEHAITQALAHSESFEAATPSILKAFCEFIESSVATLWLLNDTGTEMECAHVEARDKDALGMTSFLSETQQRRFQVGIGLPGTVWEKGGAVWLPTTLTGDRFNRAGVAAAAGLQSAIGFPIRIGSRIYGVIEFMTRHPLQMDDHLRSMLDAIGSEIGQFIQRKRAERDREELLAREKSLRERAEAANRLKDEFLATVSHELRTPLNSILGWAQIVQRESISEEDRKAALETIYRNAKSQAQLIDDLLDTSRLITGNLILNLGPTKVVPVIEAAIDVVKPAATAKSIAIETDYDPTIDTVACDSHRLQQMVWNLLANAIKFTPMDGRIDVILKKTDHDFAITVKDSGSGISPEFLPFVFDRFRQEDSSSTRKHEGLGLGLSIVRNLAELHGGAATVFSEGEGCGATFTITLPVTRVPAVKSSENHGSSDPQAQAESDLGLQGISILVIDDDNDACEMLRFVLGSLGADVSTSSSVSEAFEKISAHRPDVLLTDINMPGEDGYSLIRKLRSLTPEMGSNIPAIALTAMARPEDSERALSAGFQLHIAKPVEVEELSDTITRLVGREPVKSLQTDSSN